jgi:hypothetical protein
MKTFALGLTLVLASGLAAFGSVNGNMPFITGGGGTITDEMTVISGGTSVTITDNGSGDGNSANGTISYSNSNFNGWNISISSGTSHSPSLSPFGLDLAALTATCSGSGGCATQSLTIEYSDINFSTAMPPDGFMTTFSSTQTGSGTASESAYYSNLNTIFSMQELIGTVGPFSSSNEGQAFGGPVAANPNYSLTLVQVFTDSNNSADSFSVDGNLTSAVPEPASIFLFGTVLALSAGFLRRRKVS